VTIFHPATVAVWTAEAVKSAGDGLHARRAATGYAQKTQMWLPFDGTWIVCNGGRDLATNVHPYAHDFVRPFSGAGTTLRSYDAYGAEVLAPAAGVVCAVIDDHPETPPGRQDATGVPNLVMIDHGNNEWSVLAHLQPRSTRVQTGQAVARGDLLGRCGNSGDSTEPHIHLHLQSSADLTTMERDMLPFAFAAIVIDGHHTPHAEPVRGQQIRPSGHRPRGSA
jgi:murein DD-endopeptidase MepM/ murein hydrolase activator NlpD